MTAEATIGMHGIPKMTFTNAHVLYVCTYCFAGQQFVRILLLLYYYSRMCLFPS
jgi:hypothetical protein